MSTEFAVDSLHCSSSPSNMTEFSRITTLARQILDNATVLEAYCKDNNVKPPSFDVDGPAHFQVPPSHPQAAAAQAGLLAETLELNQLVSGPTSMLMNSDVRCDLPWNRIALTMRSWMTRSACKPSIVSKSQKQYLWIEQYRMKICLLFVASTWPT